MRVNVLKVQAKPKRRGAIKGTSRAGRRRSSSSSPARPSRSSRERSSNACPPVQADQPRPPLHDGLRLRRGDEVEAREGADREADEEGRPQQQRPHHDAPSGRRPQAPLPDHRLQAHEGRHPGEGRRDRVRPEPLGADRAAPLRRRLQVVHPRARRAARRLRGPVGPRRRHQAGQRAAAREHPDRHARPQRRAQAGQGRPDGPLRRLGHPARRQGPGLRDAASPLGRDAPRAAHLPRDGRPGRQRRPRQHHRRQGRPLALARASARPCAARR